MDEEMLAWLFPEEYKDEDDTEDDINEIINYIGKEAGS